MQENELKIRFDVGSLKAAIAVPAPFQSKGWNLILADKKGRQETLTLQRGDDRIFSSLDAAYATVRRIGFLKMLVETNGLT